MKQEEEIRNSIINMARCTTRELKPDSKGAVQNRRSRNAFPPLSKAWSNLVVLPIHHLSLLPLSCFGIFMGGFGVNIQLEN